MANCVWKYNHRFGVAYLEDKKLVNSMLDLEGGRSRREVGVMATYFSPKGKPFAWQVSFRLEKLESVAGLLGVPLPEKKSAKPAAKGRKSPGDKKAAPVTKKKKEAVGKKKTTRARTVEYDLSV